MIPVICLSLSLLGLAAVLGRRKSARVGRPIDAYCAGGVEPLPTWQRKPAPKARVGQRVG